MLGVLGPRALASYRLTFGAAAPRRRSIWSSACWSPGCSSATDFPAGSSSTRSSTCRSRCRRQSPASRSASIYAENGWLGAPLAQLGIKVAYTPLGVVVALIFIGLPFVVRTVQPVLRDLEPALEEAAATLGASRLTTLRRVVLPALAPAAATGFVLALARGLGEYGSVIFIAGNLPMKSEITSLLIMMQLEQYDYAGATAIALVFLLASFALLLHPQSASARGRRKAGR